MKLPVFSKKISVAVLAALFSLLVTVVFFHELQPAAAEKTDDVIFEVKAGDGSIEIVENLAVARLVRFPIATEIFLLMSGDAFHLKPGLYKLNPWMSSRQIADELTSGANLEVTVLVPEGMNIYEIDKILADALVIKSRDLVDFHEYGNLEGKLFPDTYKFFTGSLVRDVIDKFLKNFETKAGPVLDKDKKNLETNLIIASLVEKEVPDPHDQKIVAGILKKRLANGMPLQVDATICYIKAILAYPSPPQDARFSPRSRSGEAGAKGGQNCYPLTPLDFKISSDYNTYLHMGLAPGPIGNPGVSAINAALDPQSSPYWFYLSDPGTNKTIFAKTLEEQNLNRARYLK